MYVKIDRQRKLFITTLLRAIGYGTDAQIVELLGEEERLLNTLEKDTAKSEEDGLIEIYKRQRPGEPPTSESARNLMKTLFFDKRYDLARVGRYKFNKKLCLSARIAGYTAAEHVIDPNTGEILVEEGAEISRDAALNIENAGVRGIYVYAEDKRVRIVGNWFVDAACHLPFDPAEAGINEKVHYPTLMDLLSSAQDMDADALKAHIRANINELIPRHIVADDMVASVSYLIGMNYGIGKADRYRPSWKQADQIRRRAASKPYPNRSHTA